MGEFWLDQLKGARAGVVDHFTLDLVRVGRNDEGELVLDETGVSWDHAEIRLRDDDFWVVDENSTNGTYVNDERAHNARLKPGDVLRFGKKGPVMRFRLSAPKVSESSGEQPKAPPPKPKEKRKRAPSEPDFAVLAKPRDPSARHSDLPAAAPAYRPPTSTLNAALTVLLGGLVLASLLLLGFLYLEYTAQENELDQARQRSRDANAKLVSLRGEMSGNEDRARQAGRAAASLEFEGEVKSLENKVRLLSGEVERKSKRIAEREKRVRELEAFLAKARRDGATGGKTKRGRSWQDIERSVSPSVLLVAVELQGKKPDGTVVNLNGFGTGFFASSRGHIVTNKHVVQPWKFKKMAFRIAKEKIKVDHSSYKIHVWRGGTRFLKRGGNGKAQLDPSKGYSTTLGTLELVRTAPDKWTDVMPGKPVRAIRMHAQHGNGDIAILRAKATNVTPLQVGKSSRVRKLDDIMIVGFPAGPAVLQAGIAETSPAKGHVRKTERTINITAPMIPGNSGGPLIDAKGRVVGICTSITQDATLGSCLRIEHAMRLIHGGSW